MRIVQKLMRRPIVLKGELVAPQPGQMLVLTTETILTTDQRRAVRTILRDRFPGISGVLVLEGSMSLTVKEANDPAGEGRQDA